MMEPIQAIQSVQAFSLQSPNSQTDSSSPMELGNRALDAYVQYGVDAKEAHHKATSMLSEGELSVAKLAEFQATSLDQSIKAKYISKLSSQFVSGFENIITK